MLSYWVEIVLKYKVQNSLEKHYVNTKYKIQVCFKYFPFVYDIITGKNVIAQIVEKKYFLMSAFSQYSLQPLLCDAISETPSSH